MAWVKLDDSMPMHPKLLAAGVEAFALDVAGLAYCNRYRTDGKVAAVSLPAVLPSLKNPESVAARLVDVGRWETTEDGWLIHDYLEYQPSKDHLADLSEKRATAGRSGGLASGEARAKQVASTETNPVPSRPVDEDKSSSSLREFNTQRAFADAKREAQSSGTVRNVEALATWKAKQDSFRRESQRLWNHRDCQTCKGSGSTSVYAPGSGTRQVPCEEPV